MTNENEAPELLPCPFCGGDNLEEDAIGRVSCTGCGATAPYGYHTTETWNTRADLVAPATLPISDAKDKQVEEQVAWVQDLATELNAAEARIAELEAKLAKAIKKWKAAEEQAYDLRATLAELKDQPNDQ